MAYGVTTEGFIPKTLDELKLELEGRLRAALGSSLTLIPQSTLGVIVGVVADLLAEPWAVGEALWLAFDPDAAEGAALENLASITGTEKRQASPSPVVLTLTGDAATVLDVGRGVSVPDTGVRFETTEAATLVLADSWATSTPYAAGARVTTNNGAHRVYVCTVAGASAASGTGPTGTGTAVVDGTCTWRYLGEGRAVVDVPAESVETGPRVAVAGTLTRIDTPVTGWRNAVNLLDAVLGQEEETDAELRARRRSELRGLGNASVPAVRERLLDPDLLEGVTAVAVFENNTDATNADGMPSHSLEALVEGGDAQEIREVLYRSVAGGIRTFGGVLGTVEDEEGNPQTIRFSRPGILTLYVSATVKLLPSAPALDAQALAQLQAALLAYGDGLPAGRDVVLAKTSGALTSLPWVHDVEDVLIGLTLGDLDTVNVPVSTRQRADFDTSRMTLTLERLTQGQT